MKILTFTDLHEDYEFMEGLKQKAKEVDFILCAGDISIYETNLAEILSLLDELNKPIYIIHGNHEEDHDLAKACRETKNIKFVDKQILRFNDLVVVSHGGGGFYYGPSKEDKEFESLQSIFEDAIKSSKYSILMTHAPPFKTKLDLIWSGKHVGSKAYRNFIKRVQPTVAISGHIHEASGIQDALGKTLLINPGPEGIIIEF